MTRCFWLLTAAVLIAGGCASNRDTLARAPAGLPTPAPAGPAWIDLLGPERQAGWAMADGQGGEADVFAVEDGTLHIFGGWPHRYIAYRERRFTDFTLHVEYKVSPGANSGVFLSARLDDPVQTGLEIQVLDDHGLAPHRHGAGALYDVATPMFNLSRPAGQWNSYDITLEDDRLSVVMNGWLVLDVDLDQMTEPIGKFDTPYAELSREGYLMLQDHGGEVWYRNIRIRPAGG
jgi:hypothetical protein